MLTADVDAETAEELRRQYARELAAVVDDVGEDRLREEAGLDDGAIQAVRDGADALSLADAAAVVALDDGRSAEDVLVEVRDVLLLGMSSAVLDVEAIAADLDGLDPGEVQAKVEGRHPMTLGEYARLRHHVETR